MRHEPFRGLIYLYKHINFHGCYLVYLRLYDGLAHWALISYQFSFLLRACVSILLISNIDGNNQLNEWFFAYSKPEFSFSIQPFEAQTFLLFFI